MAIIIKNEEQIRGIRESCHLSMKTVKYLEQFIKPGTKTSELDRLAEEFIRDHGAVAATMNYNGYKYSTCLSVNDVICHGIPNQYELREGDIIGVDVSTILNGYFGDTCVTIPVGKISEYAENLMKTAKDCLDAGIREVREGNQLGNIGYVINKLAVSKGYSVVYEFCGHGVGLKFHEEPEVAHIAQKDTGPVLMAGMIFTIEPMINAGKARSKVDKRDGWTARTIDGKLSAQYEHTVLVTKTGVDVLTDLDGEYPVT